MLRAVRPAAARGLATQASAAEPLWMPFTPNAWFNEQRSKGTARTVVRGEGMHYYDKDGRAILDCSAGLWFVHDAGLTLTLTLAAKPQPVADARTTLGAARRAFLPGR